jgi:hypothetical protein
MQPQKDYEAARAWLVELTDELLVADETIKQ